MVTEQEIRDRFKWLQGFRERVQDENSRKLIDACASDRLR